MPARYAISSDVSFQAVEDTVFILDLAGGEYFSLNESGARIWNGIHGGSTTVEILEDLSAHYPDRPRQELESDLQGILQELVTRQLIAPGT